MSLFGCVDILCNNAGIADEQNWEKMVAVNMVGNVVGVLIEEHRLKGGHDGGHTHGS